MKRFDSIVDAAADRIRRDLSRIDERFPSDEMKITREEMLSHMAQTGHVYSDDCADGTCKKWRQMVESAANGGV